MSFRVYVCVCIRDVDAYMYVWICEPVILCRKDPAILHP